MASAGSGESLVRRDALSPAGQLRRRRRRERPWLDRHSAGLSSQLVSSSSCSPGSPVLTVRTSAERIPREAAADVDRALQRGEIGPLGVVDEDQQRLGFGQGQDEAVEAMLDQRMGRRPRRGERVEDGSGRGAAPPPSNSCRDAASASTARTVVAPRRRGSRARTRRRGHGAPAPPDSSPRSAAASSSAVFPAPASPSIASSPPAPPRRRAAPARSPRAPPPSPAVHLSPASVLAAILRRFPQTQTSATGLSRRASRES